MQLFEKPEIEFVTVDQIDTLSGSFECSTQYCNLQGCPDDTCPKFDWG